jgi:hypothetical protein
LTARENTIAWAATAAPIPIRSQADADARASARRPGSESDAEDDMGANREIEPPDGKTQNHPREAPGLAGQVYHLD